MIRNTVKIRYVTDVEPHSVEVRTPLGSSKQSHVFRVHFLDEEEGDEPRLLSLGQAGSRLQLRALNPH